MGWNILKTFLRENHVFLKKFSTNTNKIYSKIEYNPNISNFTCLEIRFQMKTITSLKKEKKKKQTLPALFPDNSSHVKIS